MTAPARRRELTRSERRLARRLRDGDPSVAAMIQSTYGRVLLGYLTQVLDDRGAAEDVMQQVLTEAWQRGPRYDPGRAAPLTWLMTIARSRAIDSLRRRVPEPRDPGAATALLERSTAVEDHAEELASQWRLAHLLSLLRPSQAAMLRMRFQLGMSQSEIAAQTGVPLGSVKRQMADALELLRKKMAQER